MKTIAHYGILAASMLLPTLAGAQPAAERFTRDGETYRYTVSTKGGQQIIDGRSEAGGGDFHLVVQDGRVWGTWGGKPVTFQVPAGRAVPLLIAR